LRSGGPEMMRKSSFMAAETNDVHMDSAAADGTDGGASEPHSEPSQHTDGGRTLSSSGGSGFDLTSVPTMLDSNFDKYCNGSVLRSAILNTGFPWERTRQKTILSKAEKSILNSKEAAEEKRKAFELIDALTKSGGLTIDHASLHVIVAARHSFDKTLTNTLIQDNINPIEKLELSALTAAATLHGYALC
jgi:hypothetical protein